MARFTPVPAKHKKKFKFDLKKIYADDKGFAADQKKARSLAKKLAKKEGLLKKSAKDLLEALRLSERLMKLHMRLHIYAMLKFSTNIKENRQLAEMERLGSELGTAGAFIEPEIHEMGAKKVRSFIKKEKGLAPFAFSLESILRSSEHALSKKEERVLCALSPHLTTWHHKLYNVALNREDFGTVKTPEGEELSVRRQANELSIHDNARVRRQAFDKRIKGYTRYRDIHAFTLLRTIQTQNELARLSKFRDATDRAAFHRWMTVEQFESVFKQVREHANIFKRYQKAKRKRIGSVRKLKTVRPWDLGLQPKGFEHPRYTIDVAMKTVRKALAPLGKEYIALYDELVSTKNGRLDLVSGPNRTPGGFCTKIPDNNSYIFAFGYEGFIGDLYLIAHEAGHALQGDLMAKARIPWGQTLLDPGYVTEAFAMVNEMFLFDYLRKTAPKDQKVYFEERFVAKFFDIYSTVDTAALEWDLYRAVDKGEVSTADDFDKFTINHSKDFSIYANEYDHVATKWMRIMHFTAAPLYYPSYVIAKYLSALFYQKLISDKGFVKEYLALIRNGFDRPPVDLIRDFTGVNLDDPKILSPLFKRQKEELARLEAIYKS